MLQPINDNLIVKVSKKEQQERNGFTIANPSNLQEKQDKGEVIAVGDGRIALNGTPIPMKIKVGDVILFNKFAGTEVIDEKEKYVIIKESDILAIFK